MVWGAPSFGKRKNLQNKKKQNSKKLSHHHRAVSGKRAGLCFFRSGGGKEKN